MKTVEQLSAHKPSPWHGSLFAPLSPVRFVYIVVTTSCPSFAYCVPSRHPYHFVLLIFSHAPAVLEKKLTFEMADVKSTQEAQPVTEAQMARGTEDKEKMDGNEAQSTLAPPTENEKSTTPATSSDAASGDVEKAPEPVGEEVSPRNIHGIRWALAVTSVLISAFLFALDNTIVADIQPAIVERFGEVDKISWLAVAFLVAAIGTNLFW